jgi:hypothetical protein
MALASVALSSLFSYTVPGVVLKYLPGEKMTSVLPPFSLRLRLFQGPVLLYLVGGRAAAGRRLGLCGDSFKEKRAN